MVDSPTYTPNKNFILPNTGGYVDTWGTALNTYDFTAIDTAFSGITTINWVNSGTTPSPAKELTQTEAVSAFLYIPATNSLLNNTVINLPSGVQGQWTVLNLATGIYTVTFQVPIAPGSTTAAGTTVVCNTTVSSIIFSDGTNVRLSDSRVTGAATGGGNDAVFYLNNITVTNNYTIPSGQNAMSAGPITINSGATVTIGSGSTWTVV